MLRRCLVLLLSGVLLCGGCSLLPSQSDAGASGRSSANSADAAAEPTPPEPTSRTVPVDLPSDVAPVEFTPLAFDRLAGVDRVATAVAVSRARYPSASTAVLARADHFADALAGAPLAAHSDAPILLTPPDVLADTVADELERLQVDEVILLGGEAALNESVEESLATAGYAVDRIAGTDRLSTAAAIAERVPPAGRVYVATGANFPDALTAGAAAARLPAPLLLVGDELPSAARSVIEEQRPSEVVIVGGSAVVDEGIADALVATAEGARVERLAGENRYATAAAVHDAMVGDFGAPEEVWLASSTGFADALAAGPAVAAADGTLLLTDPVDAADAPDTVDAVGEVGGDVMIVGGPAAVSDQTPRQVRAVLAGNILPRGGTVLFPKHRMIAYYGNAEHSVLGVLGETTPEEAAERIKDVAAEYADGERRVLPAFELIVSVALAGPGDDGNYSAVGPLSDVQEYLDVAREHGVYLFLDFQPGRNEFLDQVRLFERFIREPDVGIALDPEWRVTDSQRPGQLIGSADASELNEVIDYAAEIVREEDLPQKLVVVHQFRHSMIRDREELRTPPELAVTIHVDGFGNQQVKLDTWNALASPEDPWWFGFKLFYDEDTNMFAPEDVLGFTDPAVDLITYQ